MYELVIDLFIADEPPIRWAAPVECSRPRPNEEVCRPVLFRDRDACLAEMRRLAPEVLAEGRRRKAVILMSCKVIERNAEPVA